MDEPLFQSAAQALAFAFGFNREQYDRPLIYRLMKRASPSTEKRLSGLDGAAQAAMIRRRIAKLGELYESILIGRYVPAQLDCHCGSTCCSGKKVNSEWQHAMRVVAEYGEREALVNCVTKRPLTLLLLRKLIGHKISLVDIYREAVISEKTASKHYAKLKAWFLGENKSRNDQLPQAGVEQIAMLRAESVLQEAGLIGEAHEIA